MTDPAASLPGPAEAELPVPRRTGPAPATLRAYRADWTDYARWCAANEHLPIPAAVDTVVAYLAALARTHAATTLRRRLAAIGKMHRFNGLPWDAAVPAFRAVLRGGPARPPQPVAALRQDGLRRLVQVCEDTPRGRRDRALLLIGYAGALRRSELVGLSVEDVASVAGGLSLRLGPSQVLLPRGAEAGLCPVRAFDAWQAVARRRAGPLFRRVSAKGRIGDEALHPDAVRRILAHRAELAGLGSPSAHALRAGFVAEARARGAEEEEILRQTRHRDRRTLRACAAG